MLIGTTSVGHELEKHINSLEDFMQYAKSLVPQEFRHNIQLIHNQAYYNAMLLRKSSFVSWEKKKELIELVMQQVIVSGYTDIVVDVNAIYDYVDKKRVDKFWRKFNAG